MDNYLCFRHHQFHKADHQHHHYHYHNYCNHHKLRGVSDKAIAISLQEMFGVIESKKYHEGITTHHWEGIKFKEGSKYHFTQGKL